MEGACLNRTLYRCKLSRPETLCFTKQKFAFNLIVSDRGDLCGIVFLGYAFGNFVESQSILMGLFRGFHGSYNEYRGILRDNLIINHKNPPYSVVNNCYTWSTVVKWSNKKNRFRFLTTELERTVIWEKVTITKRLIGECFFVLSVILEWQFLLIFSIQP